MPDTDRSRSGRRFLWRLCLGYWRVPLRRRVRLGAQAGAERRSTLSCDTPLPIAASVVTPHVERPWQKQPPNGLELSKIPRLWRGGARRGGGGSPTFFGPPPGG